MKLVQEGKCKFPSPEWDTVSDDAKKFVKSLLQVNPNKRPSARESLQYKWIKQHYTPVDTKELKYTYGNTKPPRPTRIKLKFKSTNGSNKNGGNNTGGLRKLLDSMRGKKHG